MRLIAHQDDRAVVGADTRSFPEMIGADFSHRQSLFHGAPEPAENADLIFTRCQPIGSLAKIAEISEIHLTAVKPFKKFWPDLRMMVHKKQSRRNVVGPRPHSNRLSFP